MRIVVDLTQEEIDAIKTIWEYYPKNSDRHPIFGVREKIYKAIGRQ